MDPSKWLLLAPLLACSCHIARESCPPRAAFAPWDATPPLLEAPPRGASSLGEQLIVLYQRRLRPPLRPGWGCRMHPSCSEFGREAVRRWRALGWVLIVDRLVVREHVGMESSYLPACARGAPGDEGPHDPVP